MTIIIITVHLRMQPEGYGAAIYIFGLQARIVFSSPRFLLLRCCEVLLFCRLIFGSAHVPQAGHAEPMPDAVGASSVVERRSSGGTGWVCFSWQCVEGEYYNKKGVFCMRYYPGSAAEFLRNFSFFEIYCEGM